jgi:roadblock/LC7 domain-containing protein
LPGVNTGAVALGDFDNDGRLDILLTGYSFTGAVAQVWRNLGNGKFTNFNVGLPGVLYSAVAVGDYDNDGKLDILLTGTPNGFGSAAITQLWLNRGNGTFLDSGIDFPGVSQGAVAWGDFDQDGKLDLLLTGYSKTGAVCQVWRNVGNRSFTNMNVGLPGVYQSSVALGDYDNDGKLDILLAGVDIHSNSICQVWRNTGNWVFTNINAGLPGIHSGSVAWADFDNDGRLDLLLAGLDNTGNPMLQVYHNNTASSSAFTPRLNGLKPPGNGGYQLSFGGQIGFGYRVWASTDMIQWTALGAPNEGSPATFQFSDLSAASSRSRFYRLTKP